MLMDPSHKPQAASLKLMACSLWLMALTDLIAQDSLNVRKLGQWNQAGLPSSFLYDNTYNSVWGYARDGHEYGIIGSTMGTHIIDVTDATQPTQAAFVAGAVQGGDVVHREYKTYHDRLYCVTDEGPGTLQILDLSYLPDSVHKVYDSHALFYRAHSIWIDTTNARLYTHYGSSDFAIWSLADPDNPTLLLKPQQSVPWWGAVGGVHDAYTVNNITYTNDVDAMHIIDFTNVNAPVLLGSLTNYPQPGYNHSGWLHNNGWLYVMADETHGTDLKLFDVSDPTDIQFIDTIGTDRGPLSIPHNPCFNGDLLHVAWYEDGYWLWNVSDPAHAQLLGYYDMHPEPYSNSYKGAWGVYPFLPSGHVLISEMQHGLFVLDIDQAVGLVEKHNCGNAVLTIAPNPVQDEARIRIPSGTMTLLVTDAMGREVIHRERVTGPEVRIDTRTFAPGLYTVISRDERTLRTGTLIKTNEE